MAETRRDVYILYILIYSSYIYMYETVAVYLLIRLFTSTYIR